MSKLKIFIIVSLSFFVSVASAQVTNIPNGVTNVNRSDAFGNLPELDKTRLVVFFDDFLQPSTDDYIQTAVWTGAMSVVSNDTDGSLKVVTTDGAGDFQQWHNAATFPLISTDEAWFSCRLKSDEVSSATILVGLFDMTNVNIASATSGVFFRIDDGDSNIDFIAKAENSYGTPSVSTDSAVAIMAASTYTTFEWYHEEAEIKAFVDGVNVGSADTSSWPDSNENLSVAFAVYTSATSAVTMNIDYIYAAEER